MSCIRASSGRRALRSNVAPGTPSVASGKSPTSARGLVGREPELARDRRAAARRRPAGAAPRCSSRASPGSARRRCSRRLGHRARRLHPPVGAGGRVRVPRRVRRAAGAAAPAPRPARRGARGAGRRAAQRARLVARAARRRTASWSARRPSPCSRPPPSERPCWCSSTTCSGWTPSRRVAIAVRRPPAGTRRGRVPAGRPHRRRAVRPRAGPARPPRRRAPDRRRRPACSPTGRPGGVRDRLVAETSGNPLALLEVSQRLDAAQRLGPRPCPDALPAGERLRRVHETAVVALSPAARRAVLLLALLGRHAPGGHRGGRRARAAPARTPPPSLDEARGLGVLVRDGARHAFRHPLLRSAVLELATPAEQREAHRALAESAPCGRPRPGLAPGRGHRRHRPDRGRRAGPARGRGPAPAGLRRVVRRAGARRGLTADRDLAARRLAAAAQDAFLAGDVERVRALVDRVLAEDAPERARGEALFTLGMLEQYAGSVPRSVEHLADASDLLDGPLRVRALAELAVARFRLNDVAGMVECARPDRGGRRPRRTPSSSSSPRSPAASPSC